MPELFNPVFTLPSFLLRVTDSAGNGSDSPAPPESGDEKVFKVEGAGRTLEIRYSGVNPEPVILQNECTLAAVFGSPIFERKIKAYKICDIITFDGKIDKEFIKGLNGEFLIIVFSKLKGLLSVANDRFTSIPFYYHVDPKDASITASMYFSDIWGCLKNEGRLKMSQTSFFEFLWFQRLFGVKTLAEDAFFMPDASVMTFAPDGKTDTSRYWRRSYEKSIFSLKNHAYIMSELMKESVRQKTSDGKRYGHFLSGGMDSRSVLAAFNDSPPVCFTATIADNREQRVARKLAKAKGAEHVFLQLDPEQYGKILKPSVHVTGGMYNYDHGLFFGFNDAVRSRADVCFHGHGFDYMFQGMYIPGRSVSVFGHTLHLRKLVTPPEDLISYFIHNASYRIKGADVWAYVQKPLRAEYEEFQRNSVSEILSQGSRLTKDPHDLWEYLTFHHISRHYSYPNHASIATFAEQRTVSFFNDLFNLYLSLPVEHRFNGKIEKMCLTILDPKLARIWSANTNLPVTASPLRQTIYQLAAALKRRLIPVGDQKETWEERTWPSREHALRSQPSLRAAVTELCDGDTLAQLEFLDLPKLKSDVRRWLQGENVPGVSGDLVQTILNMGTFLNQ